MSSDIRLKYTIKAFTQFKVVLRMGEESTGMLATPELSSLHLLHSATGCLQQDIAATPKVTDYPSVAAVELKCREMFVPATLAKALLWLLDRDALNSLDKD